MILVLISFGVMACAQNTKRYYCELVAQYEIKDGYEQCSVVISIFNDPFKAGYTGYENGYKLYLDDGYVLVKEDGRRMKSITDAANHLSQQGWLLIQTYSISTIGTVHYVMFKDAPNGRKAVENLWIGEGSVSYGTCEKSIPLSEEILFEDEDEIEGEDDIEE